MKKLTMIIASIMLTPSVATAYCGAPPDILPPPIPAVVPKLTNTESPTLVNTRHYWKTCYASIEGHSFSGSAKRDLDQVQADFVEYYENIKGQDTENTSQKIDTMNGLSAARMELIIANNSSLEKAKLQLQKQLSEMRMQQDKLLSEEKMNDKNQGFFYDENGSDGIVRTNTPSYKYMKGICKRSKMNEATSSPFFKEKQALAINLKMKQSLKEMTSKTGNTDEISGERTALHYSSFCSASDIDLGFCTNPNVKLCIENDVSSGVCSVSENEILSTSNKNNSAPNFLTPDGFDGRYSFNGDILEEPKNRIENELFDVKYTYSDEDVEAAEAFLENIVLQPGVKAPTKQEFQMESKQLYLTHYNSYISQLNLAETSFRTAISKRMPITEGEINMSELDVMRYSIHTISNADNIAATFSGKEKAIDLLMFQITTINNKLALMVEEQEERMEMLEAVLVIQNENKASKLNILNEIR